jgi:trigger factor
MSAPELTDELATELGYESVEDMHAKVANEISSGKEENLKNQARVQILQHLVENNEFEVPQAMVEEQLKALMNELRMQQMYMGRNPDDVQFSEAQRQDLSTRAVFAAKAACLLGSVNDLEDLKVTDEDIELKLEELAESQGQTVESIKQYINMEQASDMLSERVQEEKTLNWLLQQAVRLDAPKEEPATEVVEEAVEAGGDDSGE